MIKKLVFFVLFLTCGIFFHVKSDQAVEENICQKNFLDEKKEKSKIDIFVNNVRDKSAFYGVLSYLLTEVMLAKGFRAKIENITFKKSGKNKSGYGQTCDIFYESLLLFSGLPFLSYIYFSLADGFVSALLEKDSSLSLRLCRHAIYPKIEKILFPGLDKKNIDRGKHKIIDIVLAIVEEVLRLGIYKSAKHFYPKDTQRESRVVFRILAIGAMFLSLGFANGKLKSREGMDILGTVYCSVCLWFFTLIPEAFAHQWDEEKKIIAWWKGKDFNPEKVSLGDIILFAEEGAHVGMIFKELFRRF